MPKIFINPFMLTCFSMLKHGFQKGTILGNIKNNTANSWILKWLVSKFGNFCAKYQKCVKDKIKK